MHKKKARTTYWFTIIIQFEIAEHYRKQLNICNIAFFSIKLVVTPTLMVKNIAHILISMLIDIRNVICSQQQIEHLKLNTVSYFIRFDFFVAFSLVSPINNLLDSKNKEYFDSWVDKQNINEISSHRFRIDFKCI